MSNFRGPVHYCASIFRRELTFRAGPPRTSKLSPLHSTTAPASPLTGRRPSRFSTNNYARFNSLVLQRPIELAQYTPIDFAETLVLEGIAAPTGSVDDAYDNALAESTIGLLKDRSSLQEQSVSARPGQDDRRHRILGRWSEWIGSTLAACTAPWTISLPTSSKPSITLNYRFSSRRCRQRRSGKKPGTVQLDGHSCSVSITIVTEPILSIP